jgi:hypothetical protein
MIVMNFERALRAYLEDGHRLNAIERRALRMLNLPASTPRRKRFLSRFKTLATDHLGGPVSDWSAIDWPTLIATLLQLIKALLDLFGG